jgi:hypothetical protein
MADQDGRLDRRSTFGENPPKPDVENGFGNGKA